MSQASFFAAFNRQIADTSREAFEQLRPTLNERERVTYLRLWHYCEATGYPDATGGELAERFDIAVTSIRPRLTGLLGKGWVSKGPIRHSRVAEEMGRCRGYKPEVPREAVERIR